MPRLELVRVRPERPASWWDALRSYWKGSVAINSKELLSLFGLQPLASYDPDHLPAMTEELALNYAAVWAAVSLIADDTSSLPLMLYKRLPNGGKDRFEDHPLYMLLHDAPNPEMSTMTWRQTITAHMLTWGNGYSEIERDGAGRPRAIWPLTPDRVTPFRQDGRLKYRVRNANNVGEIILEGEDIVHVHGLGFDGITGYSVIAKARESLSVGIATERFGAAFFKNGSTFGGVFEHPGRMSQPAQDNFRKIIEQRHQGVERAGKFIIVEEGMKYHQLGIPPDDAQFLETRVFQIREVARWFKIPPHKLADLADATFSNVEHLNIDYYTSCLRPWLELWEQELTKKLVARLERKIQFVEHVTQGLLKADATGRAALHSADFNTSSITPNEIRGLENRDPLKGGDRAFVPLNMIPLDRVDEWIDAQIKAKTQPSQPAAAPPPSAPTQEDLASWSAGLADQLAARSGAIVQQLTEALAQAETRIAGLTLTTAELTVIRQTLEAELAARAPQIAALETQVEALRQDGEKTAAALVRLRPAHRALLVDAVDRLVLREGDRVRKAQATADKLRTWLEGFYPTYADVIRAVLRPVLLAWAAVAELEPEALVDREVARYLEESQRALEIVLLQTDPDEMAAELARLLRRWETERAGATADRLLQEGTPRYE